MLAEEALAVHTILSKVNIKATKFFDHGWLFTTFEITNFYFIWFYIFKLFLFQTSNETRGRGGRGSLSVQFWFTVDDWLMIVAIP